VDHATKDCTKDITCDHCAESGHEKSKCQNKDKPPTCLHCGERHPTISKAKGSPTAHGLWIPESGPCKYRSVMNIEPLNKIVQINLARSMAASDDLYKYCVSNKVDIALIQEPYTRRSKLINLEYSGIRTAKSKTIYYWAAIVIFNYSPDIISKPQLSTTHTVVVSVSLPDQTLVDIMSSYFQYRKETEFFTQEIARINTQLANRLIFGVDANAFSPRWGDPRRNDRSRLVEQLIMDTGYRWRTSPATDDRSTAHEVTVTWISHCLEG